jgi:mRNA interferase HigB
LREAVRIISKRRLREFWQSRKADAAQAERDLLTWHTLASKATWANFAELKQTFGSADRVGNCIVFDVGNNRYRLIGRVIYNRKRVYVLKVMDHKEYDKQQWIADCGCDQPPPLRRPARQKQGKRPRSEPQRKSAGHQKGKQR